MKINLDKKIETCYVGRCYYVERLNMRGNYCPATGEYYIARYENGKYDDVAAHWFDDNGCCHEILARGYSYEVARELLQLGHLTAKTLASFINAGGEVWWNK